MTNPVVFAAMPIGKNDHIAIAFKEYLSKVDIAIVETKKVFINFCQKNNINIDEIYESTEKNIIDIIKNGILNEKNILVVSNDGYPNIQDFGMSLVQKLIYLGIDIDLIPGPNSVLQALFFSGFENSAGQFYFAGRIPINDTIGFLKSLSDLSCPIILICIPFLEKYIDDIYTVFPNKEIAICIDISKPNQKILRGKTNNIKEKLKLYRVFPFNFNLISGAKTNIHSFYSDYTLVIS